MLRHRGSRPTLLTLNNTTAKYEWQSERDLGFFRAELVFGTDGKLMAVDYTPAERSPGPKRAVDPKEVPLPPGR